MAWDAMPSATGRDVRPYGPRALRDFIARGWLEQQPFVDVGGPCRCGEPGCESYLDTREGQWFVCCPTDQEEPVPVDRETLVRFTVHHGPLIAELRARNAFAPTPVAQRLWFDVHLVGERLVGAQSVAVVFVGPLHDARVPQLTGLIRQAVPTQPVVLLTAERAARLTLAVRDGLWAQGIYPVPLVAALAAPDDLVVRDDVLIAGMGRGAALPLPHARPRLLVDRQYAQVWWDGAPLTVTPQQFRLIEVLALAAKAGAPCVTRTQIGTHVWDDAETLPNTMDTAITSVRQLLAAPEGASAIESLKRRGVRLVLPPDAVHIREPPLT
jgi:DNA-binding winged helix-turn-helix (wHTH) protein